MALRESPLTVLHEQANAKMTAFAEWRLPVQYASVAQEVQTTRRAAGLFDISHMGRIHLLGPGAAKAARKVLTRDVTAVPPGCGGYALLCNLAGGIMDDLIFLVLSDKEIVLVVNAANHDKDLAWIAGHLDPSLQVRLEDMRERGFGIALQGPASEAVLSGAGTSEAIPDLFGTVSQLEVAGASVLVSRTGYTGEDGFELFGAADQAATMWQTLSSAGRDFGLVPAGLAARDVLRQEMGYPLWGNDIDENTTPQDAGLGWAVDWSGDFVGRAALEGAQPARRRLGFVLQQAGVARRGAAISRAGEPVGTVTSGTYSHNLTAAIGQGYVLTASKLGAGDEIEIEVRGRMLPARLHRFPLVARRTRPSWTQGERKPL